jgi:hypothetical protein
MSQRNKLITPPAIEPVSIDQAKQHARIEYPDDDDLVAGLITAARLVCETELSRSFISQTWETYLDHWPWPGQTSGSGAMGYYRGNYIPQIQGYPYTPWSTIEIDNPNLVSVASISYVDATGTVQTLDPAAYQVVTGAPGRIHPAYGHTWPAVRSMPGAITVQYLAGYGPAATDVPECIRTAIKMMVAELYEQREMTATQAYQCNPIFAALLSPCDWGNYP